MHINENQVKGRIEEAKGKVKEVAGKVIGDKGLEIRGIAQKTWASYKLWWVTPKATFWMPQRRLNHDTEPASWTILIRTACTNWVNAARWQA